MFHSLDLEIHLLIHNVTVFKQSLTHAHTNIHTNFHILLLIDCPSLIQHYQHLPFVVLGIISVTVPFVSGSERCAEQFLFFLPDHRQVRRTHTHTHKRTPCQKCSPVCVVSISFFFCVRMARLRVRPQCRTACVHVFVLNMEIIKTHFEMCVVGVSAKSLLLDARALFIVSNKWNVFTQCTRK